MKNDGFDLRFDGDRITNDQTFGNSANSYYIYIYIMYIYNMDGEILQPKFRI